MYEKTFSFSEWDFSLRYRKWLCVSPIKAFFPKFLALGERRTHAQRHTNTHTVTDTRSLGHTQKLRLPVQIHTCARKRSGMTTVLLVRRGEGTIFEIPHTIWNIADCISALTARHFSIMMLAFVYLRTWALWGEKENVGLIWLNISTYVNKSEIAEAAICSSFLRHVHCFSPSATKTISYRRPQF
jgi:hypothetical protein